MFTISFKSQHADAVPGTRERVEAKIRNLEKLLSQDALCEIELEKLPSHHSGDIFRVEVNLSYEGQVIRAEATSDSFDTAADQVEAELGQQLRKRKRKMMLMIRKGGARLKNMMRFGRE